MKSAPIEGVGSISELTPEPLAPASLDLTPDVNGGCRESSLSKVLPAALRRALEGDDQKKPFQSE